MLKRPSPGWKHTVLVISLVAFPFQDLFDAFVISVQRGGKGPTATGVQSEFHFDDRGRRARDGEEGGRGGRLS